ncbi:PAS domain S-box protein [uncultured Maribacter sp.]|uniref:PAS domain-containing sensor histidine kinase n=1 Tax=uncultured Maribacter sp. TaxID=431308 RepID=UPI00262F7E5E|nr:PAS domain S-box protein [uncultured Maribacter sp.]
MERHHQIFIEQTPTAIAMLDTNMVYLAVSKRWIKDFVFEDEDIVGRSHYDIFPEIGDDWKEKNQLCLKGAIDICDEAPFYRKDGSIQWIYWDVRPWYNAEGEIGGLLMHTGDITEQKERELEKKRAESILNDTSEIARISTWEINLSTQELLWNKMAYEIYEVADDFRPTVDAALEFFKYDEDRQAAKVAIQNAIDYGSAVDMDVEMLTAKGNSIWAKITGKVESLSGVPTRFYGILQDVSNIRLTEQRLNRAYTELEAIFNSKSTAIITTDKDGIINRFNKGAEKLLGYTADEIVGLEKPDIYLLKEERDKFENDITLLFRGDSFIADAQYNYRNENINDTRQWTFRRKDGSMFSTLTSITAINSSEGINDGFISVVTDISKIKDVKNELRKKNDLLNFAERLSLIGHWQWNTVLDRVQWSENLYTIFELEESVTELQFDTYFNFVHPEDKDLVAEYFKKSANDKKFYSFIHKIITVNGVVKTIHLVGKAIANKKGEIFEMFGTCQDVTESKEEELKLIRAKEELEIVAQKLAYQNKQLADFTHITSHNLRAPVANLNSLMEIYKLSDDDEERLDIFSKFDTVIDRLTLTLNTLIEALKTKISDAQEELESVDLNEIFEDTIQTLSGSILTSGAVIKGDFRELSTITYNRIYMDSIFLNLIGNAIKYKAKDRAPEIIVKSKVKNGRNIITFKDNGLGIDLERHGHKLFGLNKVFHRHPDAKGVGLFLTKTQVEAMGGTITATSEVNVGTTFTIIF